MALYKRANLNMFSLLNHCYNNFTTSTVKLKMDKHVTTLNSILPEKFKQQNRKTEILSTDIKSSLFEMEIAKRRDEARRSILVQVYSSASQEDLRNYCTKFGVVQSIHHYRTNKRHFILVEFRDKAAVKEIISRASFMNSEPIVSVKSSVLWFRRNGIKQDSQMKIASTTENGDLYPSVKQITQILYHSKSISEQIMHLHDTLKLNDLEMRLRFHTAHHLEQYFAGLFCNMKVLPFGSSINGFGRKRCDLDLVLIPDDIKENNTKNRLVFHSKAMRINEKYETKELMLILASTMQHFIPGIENVRRILEARVPIIKFNFEYNNLECDLSTTNMAAVYMSELLNLYGEIDWRVRPLVLMIRKWAKSQDLTCDSPGPWITNFSLSLLVLFYLQQKNILPSLKRLKIYATRNDARHTENGINCTFLRDIKKLPNEYKYKLNQDNLETLLIGFLEYYSNFDFYTKGICIREGIPIRKPSHSALHIVNPLETTLNVSKNVNIYEVNRLIEKAHNAIFLLETTEKSKCANWGLMKLLKIKSDIDVTNISGLGIVKNQNVENNSGLNIVENRNIENNSGLNIVENRNIENNSELNIVENRNIENNLELNIIENSNIENNCEENHSYEISDKIVNTNDIEPEKKEETV